MTVSKKQVYVWTVAGCILLGVIKFDCTKLFSSGDADVDMEFKQRVRARRQTDLDPEMPREGFLITMHNESGWQTARELQRVFEIETMHVVMGHVGLASRLPLYNLYVMQTGRTDDLQIGNLNMLGCIESHREVWMRIKNTSYVFEHDAKPNENSRQLVHTLLRNSAASAWSVLLLQKPNAFSTSNQVLPETNQFRNIGEIGQSCQNCIAFGCRGYIVTKTGAEILLENYSPPVVQVDAYLSLLNAYHDNFTLIWTRVHAVDWILSWTTQQDISEIQTWNRWIKQKHPNT